MQNAEYSCIIYVNVKDFAEKNGWKVEELSSEEGEAGGYSQVEFKIKGDNVYSKLKYESGSHRVQRVPVTESNGRIQTSTATVLVMPEVDDIDIEMAYLCVQTFLESPFDDIERRVRRIEKIS